MDKGKVNDSKKGLISKTWERCKSFSNRAKPPNTDPRQRQSRMSKSWNSFSSLEHLNRQHRRDGDDKSRVAPEGCFSVYVGINKQRFVVKAKYANHPLFMALLEEAEIEYGFNSVGPIELPCDVNVFFRVLMEMDSDDGVGGPRRGCGLPTVSGAYRLLSPSRMVAINRV